MDVRNDDEEEDRNDNSNNEDMRNIPSTSSSSSLVLQLSETIVSNKEEEERQAQKRNFYSVLEEKFDWKGKCSQPDGEEEEERNAKKGGGGEENGIGRGSIEKASEYKLSNSRSIIDDCTMKRYIDIIKNFKSCTKKKTAESYYLLNRYIVKDGHLYNKRKGTRMIPLGEVFDEIYKSHKSTGHGGEKRTFYDLKSNRGIANISLKHVGLFISTCKICLKKRAPKSSLSSDAIITPIISSNFGERGQVDLIDMSSFKTTQHRYILNYQDHFTKFCVIRPLINKYVSSVVKELIDIFSIIGCPRILQSDNGLEFKFDDELKKIWPGLLIVHGRPRHPQSQGSVERANQDIEQIMRCWLADNNTTNWVSGLPFIQMQKNNGLNRTIQCSPFFAVFGKNMSIDNNISNSNSNDVAVNEDDNDDGPLALLPIQNGENDSCSSNSNDNNNGQCENDSCSSNSNDNNNGQSSSWVVWDLDNNDTIVLESSNDDNNKMEIERCNVVENDKSNLNMNDNIVVSNLIDNEEMNNDDNDSSYKVKCDERESKKEEEEEKIVKNQLITRTIFEKKDEEEEEKVKENEDCKIFIDYNVDDKYDDDFSDTNNLLIVVVDSLQNDKESSSSLSPAIEERGRGGEVCYDDGKKSEIAMQNNEKVGEKMKMFNDGKVFDSCSSNSNESEETNLVMITDLGVEEHKYDDDGNKKSNENVEKKDVQCCSQQSIIISNDDDIKRWEQKGKKRVSKGNGDDDDDNGLQGKKIIHVAKKAKITHSKDGFLMDSNGGGCNSDDEDDKANTNKLKNLRRQISVNIRKEAQRMIDNDKKKKRIPLQDGKEDEAILKPDTIVTAKIPRWDKQHKLNLDNIICRIVEYLPNINKYKLASLETDIVIKNLFSPRQIKECKNYKPNIDLRKRTKNNNNNKKQKQREQSGLCLRSVVLKEQSLLFSSCKCISLCDTQKCPCQKAKRKCIKGLCHIKSKKCRNK